KRLVRMGPRFTFRSTLNSMLNRLTNSYREQSASGRPWQTDQNPASRLIALFVLINLPLVAVAGRLAYVQTQLADDYVAAFEQTTESFETIPAVNGRILGVDGRELAKDVRHIDIEVHYRWLEDPP